MAFHLNGYSNFHDDNQDWIVSKIKNIDNAEAHTEELAEAAQASADASQASAEAAQASADASQLSANASQASAENSQESAEASAASELSAKNYAEHIADPVAGLVATWLTDHITNPTNPPIDTSLSVAGAAADAKAAGDKITELTTEIDKLTDAAEVTSYERVLNVTETEQTPTTTITGQKIIHNNTHNLFGYEASSGRNVKIYTVTAGKYRAHGYGNNDTVFNPIAVFSPTLNTDTSAGWSDSGGIIKAGSSDTNAWYDVELNPTVPGYIYVTEGATTQAGALTRIDEVTVEERKQNYGVLVDDETITHFIETSKGLLCRQFERFGGNNLLDIHRMFIGGFNGNGGIDVVTTLGVSNGDTVGPISIHRGDIDSWIGEWSGGVHTKTLNGAAYPTAKQNNLSILCNGLEVTQNGVYYGDVVLHAENYLYFPQTVTGNDLSTATLAIKEYRTYKLTDKMCVDVLMKPQANSFYSNLYYGLQFYTYDANKLYLPNDETDIVVPPSAMARFNELERFLKFRCASGAYYDIKMLNYGLGTYKHNNGETEYKYGNIETFNKGYMQMIANSTSLNTSKALLWSGEYNYYFTD